MNPLETNSANGMTADQASLHTKDDTFKAFSDIHSSSENLRRQMIEISHYGSQRTAARQWTDNMRFIVMDWSEGGEELEEKLGYNSKANTSRSSKPSNASVGPKPSRPAGLKLKDRKSLANSSSYVAVSYCWNREYVDWFPDQDPLLISGKDQLLRRISSPNDVLIRSMAYAAHENVHSIWIDQECIDQDDPSDKEHGIQAMDIVYQEASHPIAILETYFDSQAEVDSFSSIVDYETFPFQPSQIEVLEEILDSLASDSWFTRAWTLQESISAGASMVLLIGCGTHLSKPEFLGPTLGEIEISIWDFQNAMVNARLMIEEHLAAKTWPDERTAIQASNSADELWNLFPSIYPNSTSRPRDSSHRQSCSAAQAFRFLDYRSNSFFPDRLSILANLCNYEYRIDSRVLEQPQYAFTTCAMTLAILNGDMSLLGGHGGVDLATCGEIRVNARSLRNVFVNDDTDSSSNAFGFSWGPIPTGRLRDVMYREELGDILRLKPSTLSMDGLRVSGMLWHVDHLVHVPETQTIFSSRWQQELEAQKTSDTITDASVRRSSTFAREFLWTLLNELMATGHTKLVKSIWNFVQPYGIDKLGLTSKSIERPYPFDIAFSHFEKAAESKDLPRVFDQNEIIKNISTLGLLVDPDSQVYETASLERVLIEQVCSTGNLICGSPMKCAESNEHLVFFEACKKGDLIFTPWTSLGSRISISSYKNEALSWRVMDTEKMTGHCQVLRCLGRRRGYWNAEDCIVVDYILE